MYDMFELDHCYRKTADGEPDLDEHNICKKQCPGWDWSLERTEGDEVLQGNCRYRKSAMLCECLKLAAEGHYVIEIRPKNEDDIKREQKQEREQLEQSRRRLIQQKAELEEKILGIENQMRDI